MRSAASVRQIGGVLISCAYLEAVQDRRVDGLQPAGALETIAAASMQLYVEKADTVSRTAKEKPRRSEACVIVIMCAISGQVMRRLRP